jgi:hypothetical protein
MIGNNPKLAATTKEATDVSRERVVEPEEKVLNNCIIICN